MYKFSDNQISFSDFGQPVGMPMNPNNRWVKKAEQIPWAEIERRYAKLDISVVDGYTRLETYSFDNYNEATFLKAVIERYRTRTGHYPKRVLADKIYRNRENLRFCKEHGIRLSAPALGRPRKDEQTNKQQDYADICERVEVERRISLAKRKCGLGLLTRKLAATTASAIALSIVVLNLRKIQHTLLHFLQLWLLSYRRLVAQSKS